MMEERYHATTKNRFYPDMSNVNKNYYSGGKTYQPTYVHLDLQISMFTPDSVDLYTRSSLISSPVPVAAQSKAWVCGRWPAEIVDSNPTGGMDVLSVV